MMVLRPRLSAPSLLNRSATRALACACAASLLLAGCSNSESSQNVSATPAATPAQNYAYEGPAYPTPSYDIEGTIEALKTLSSDSMEGRAAGTTGGKKASQFIMSKNDKLMRSQHGLIFPFERAQGDGKSQELIKGTNLGIFMPGKAQDMNGPILVITAHYDHLGMKDGDIYNGADDNASGAAALLAITESFNASPPENNVMIVWLDAEEHGLAGAKAFAEHVRYFNGASAVNLNLDMIAQSQEGELYMVGSYHTPALGPLMAKAAHETGLTLKFGHDRPEDADQDWTRLSDHGVFHEAGIPFVYFGVEDHPQYHKPTDTFETLPLEFYKSSLKTVVNAAHILDENLADLARPAIDPKPAD